LTFCRPSLYIFSLAPNFQALRAINALNDSYRDKKSPGNLQVRFAHTKLEKDKIEQSKQVSFSFEAYHFWNYVYIYCYDYNLI
jgi:hypothetical protein